MKLKKKSSSKKYYTKKEKELKNHNVKEIVDAELAEVRSANKKLSRGAANISRIIKTRGGWDSKISGKERDRNHRKAK